MGNGVILSHTYIYRTFSRCNTSIILVIVHTNIKFENASLKQSHTTKCLLLAVCGLYATKHLESAQLIRNKEREKKRKEMRLEVEETGELSPLCALLLLLPLNAEK